MFSIGQLSKKTGVKVPTIRYYENMKLIAQPDRTAGNQRRYDQAAVDKLGFIKRARDLGFTIEAILALMRLQNHPDQPCREAADIAYAQLSDVRLRIKRLRTLETELKRITDGCRGNETLQDCYIMASLVVPNNSV